MHSMYIEQTFQDKTYAGSILCKIHKRIIMNIDMIAAPNDTTSLEYVVNPSCYQPLSFYWSH